MHSFKYNAGNKPKDKCQCCAFGNLYAKATRFVFLLLLFLLCALGLIKMFLINAIRIRIALGWPTLLVSPSLIWVSILVSAVPICAVILTAHILTSRILTSSILVSI